jgi:mRNA interferase YafQ
MKVEYTNQFRKDMKRLSKRSSDQYQAVKHFIDKYFVNGDGRIPINYKPHKLSGNYKSHWECHIKSDLLLVWLSRNNNTVIIVRCGTHPDLFC